MHIMSMQEKFTHTILRNAQLYCIINIGIVKRNLFYRHLSVHFLLTIHVINRRNV